MLSYVEHLPNVQALAYKITQTRVDPLSFASKSLYPSKSAESASVVYFNGLRFAQTSRCDFGWSRISYRYAGTPSNYRTTWAADSSSLRHLLRSFRLFLWFLSWVQDRYRHYYFYSRVDKKNSLTASHLQSDLGIPSQQKMKQINDDDHDDISLVHPFEPS